MDIAGHFEVADGFSDARLSGVCLGYMGLLPGEPDTSKGVRQLHYSRWKPILVEPNNAKSR
jgi:hypothetical protein